MNMLGMISRHSQRQLSLVPRNVILMLIISLTVYIGISSRTSLPKPNVENLENPPPIEVLRLVSFGDDPFLSRVVIFWLQMHDYQNGISIAYRDIDYQRLASWLGVSLELDPGHEYPLLLASRVYGMVNDRERQKIILDFVAEKFKQRPEERWPWLAHAVYMANHRVKDKELALKYARMLANNTESDTAPKWARQMHVFILADMGEVEAAKVLLGGLYESGQLQDQEQYKFLLRRLEANKQN